MDLVIVLFWFLAFTVIVLFLGALNYFIGRPSSTVKISDKSQSDTMKEEQPLRTSSNRRKHARNANKKQRQQAAIATATTNDDSNSNDNDEKQEKILIIPKIEVKEEEEEESVIESSRQQSDEEQENKEEFHDIIKTEEVLTPSSSPPPAPIREKQQPTLPVKQRNKNRTNNTNSRLSTPPANTNFSSTASNSSKDESVFPSKPQACVAPVKQAFLPSSKDQSITIIESVQIPQDNNSHSNGNISSLYNIYSHSGYNPLPPRFRQQKPEGPGVTQKLRKRKAPIQPKKMTIPPDSAARQNDFIPSTKQTTNLAEASAQQELSVNNGYSSESDRLSESVSTACNNVPTESPVLLKGLGLMRSLTSSHALLDELISVFETVSFSSDELELILNKIATKHLLNKQDWQRLLSTTTKNDKTIEHILDETYRSQLKILAIELQTEKNHVLELTKTNADMNNMIRQLQQQQPNNMAQYQQTILSYQMQLRRLTDENARLAHQLHAYSMMPSAINDLKQQQHILNEQLRQLTIKNSALEKEIADGERASRHAAEIYKKADAQKQERIEQMIGDINKYKKLDKESATLRQKHTDLEKTLNSKLNDITCQRDELKAYCDQATEKVQQYEQLKIQYDQLIQNQENEQTKTTNIDALQKELNEVKAKNDLLRQRNWKVMEQLNKLSDEQRRNQKVESS